MGRNKKEVEIVNEANENAIANKETEGLSQGQIASWAERSSVMVA